MKITQDVRDYAAGLNEKEQGMAAMSDKFNAMGEQVYVDAEKVKESNKAFIASLDGGLVERTALADELDTKTIFSLVACAVDAAKYSRNC